MHLRPLHIKGFRHSDGISELEFPAANNISATYRVSVEVWLSLTHLEKNNLSNKHGCGLADQLTDRNGNSVSTLMTTVIEPAVE